MKWIKAAVFFGALAMVLLGVGIRSVDRRQILKELKVKENES